jgi:serine/threonine-protein kinase HipA
MANKSIKISILQTLIAKPASNTKDIAADTGISRVTIGGHLQDLLEDGYITAEPLGRSTIYSLSNQSPANSLAVFFGNELVGYLSLVDKKYAFRYAVEHLTRNTISYRLAAVDFEACNFVSEALFPDFDGILPEGRDREILIAKARSATEFDLLGAIEYDFNELRFVQSESVGPEEKASTSNRRQRYSEVKNKILGVNTFPNIITSISGIPQGILFPPAEPTSQNRYTGRTLSLSGFQHKFGMTQDLSSGEFRLSTAGYIKTHFVKPYYLEKASPSSENYLPHAALNEHLHLSFAKNELGMDVAESGIFKNSENDQEYHYIVKMFDRDGAIKYDIKEVATLIGLQTENKYDISAEGMFAKILPYMPIEEERKKIFAYFFYSFLIKHADMHTKNLSIVVEYANGADRLCSASPLYDIATTSVYGGLSEIESSLKISGKDREIGYDDFVALARGFGLKEKTFKEIAASMMESYINVMPTYYNKVKEMNLKVIKNRYPGDFGEWLIKAHQKRVKDLYDRGWIESLSLKVFIATPEKMVEFAKDEKAVKFLTCCSKVAGRAKIVEHFTKNRMASSLDVMSSIPDVDNFVSLFFEDNKKVEEDNFFANKIK